MTCAQSLHVTGSSEAQTCMEYLKKMDGRFFSVFTHIFFFSQACPRWQFFQHQGFRVAK
jgi:hypothetical protein